MFVPSDFPDKRSKSEVEPIFLLMKSPKRNPYFLGVLCIKRNSSLSENWWFPSLPHLSYIKCKGDRSELAVVEALSAPFSSRIKQALSLHGIAGLILSGGFLRLGTELIRFSRGSFQSCERLHRSGLRGGADDRYSDFTLVLDEFDNENNCNGPPLLFNNIDVNFAYLFDLFPDGSLRSIDHTMSIFDINALHRIEFNLSTIENPKNIRNRIRLENRGIWRYEELPEEALARSYEDMPGIDRSIAEQTDPTKKAVKQKKEDNSAGMGRNNQADQRGIPGSGWSSTEEGRCA